jgi:hypothetical protein
MCIHCTQKRHPSSDSDNAISLTTPTVSIMVAIASQTPRLTAMLAGTLDGRRSFGGDAERGSRRRRSAPGAAGTTSSSALPMAQHSCSRPASCAAAGAAAAGGDCPRALPAETARGRCR